MINQKFITVRLWFKIENQRQKDGLKEIERDKRGRWEDGEEININIKCINYFDTFLYWNDMVVSEMYVGSYLYGFLISSYFLDVL